MKKTGKLLSVLLAVVILAVSMPFSVVSGADANDFNPEDLGSRDYRTSADGLWYYCELGDGTVKIRSKAYSELSVVIPSTVDGKTVTAIDEYAVPGGATDVFIPDTVTAIGNYAFYGRKEIKAIIIPDSVKTIGVFAFYGCKGLKNLTIGQNVESIGNSAFTHCEQLKNVVIPDSVKVIGGGVFSECTLLENITMSKNLESLGSGVFKDTAYINNAENWENGGLYIGKALAETNSTANQFVIKPGTKIIAATAFWHNSLSSVVIPDTVENIGSYAFSCCYSLETVTIPESVSYIGASAFDRCTALKAVTIPSAVTAIESGCFQKCTSLESVVLNENITVIGKNAFEGCTSLKHLNLNNNIKEINGYAFSGCSLLEGLFIPANIEIIGDYAFKGCTLPQRIVLPSTSKSISPTAFKDSTGFEYMTIYYNPDIDYSSWRSQTDTVIVPDGVDRISERAFMNFWNVKSITLPDSVKTLEDYAFYYSNIDIIELGNGLETIGAYALGATPLKTIDLPETLKVISDNAFFQCEELESIVIPEAVISIGDFAFQSCSKLEGRFYIPKNVEHIGVSVFSGDFLLSSINVDPQNQHYVSVDGVLYNKDKTVILCYPADKSNLTEYTIAPTVVKIEDSAFDGNEYLESITLPPRLEYIGRWAFIECSNLAKISKIPSSVNYIGRMAFVDCKNLRSDIIIPEGVKDIDTDLFMNCERVKRIELPKSIDSMATYYVFAGCCSLQSLSIPEGVTKIHRTQLERCYALKSIVLPKSLTEIEARSFDDCSSLETIYGYSGTYAESFANSNGYNFIALDLVKTGDLTGDDSVGIEDYALLKQLVSGEIYVAPDQLAAADANGDSTVDAFDMFFIDRMINNLA